MNDSLGLQSDVQKSARFTTLIVESLKFVGMCGFTPRHSVTLRSVRRQLGLLPPLANDLEGLALDRERCPRPATHMPCRRGSSGRKASKPSFRSTR
jgi:hypothetical protein